jgi:ankyrin repeat protein
LAPAHPKHEGHVRVVEALVEAGADLETPGNYQSYGPLRLAAACGVRALVEPLLAGLRARLVEPDPHERAALYDLDGLSRALEADPSQVHALDAMGRTPLHAVAGSRLWRDGDPGAGAATAARLLEAGAEVDPPQRLAGKHHGTPLWWVCSFGRDPGLAAWLLERGASPKGCMLVALWHPDEGLGRALLRAGGDLEERDVRGFTVLQHLLMFGRVEGALAALALGADPNAQGPKGLTALHLAAQFEQGAEVFDALLGAGARWARAMRPDRRRWSGPWRTARRRRPSSCARAAPPSAWG